MAEIKKEDFFKHLDSLTVIELADYIKEFEERYGIKAEMAAMPAGAAVPAAVAEEEAEEKTDFDIILKTVGTKKINVIKVVREVTDLGLKEAKAVVDAAPGEVKKVFLKKKLRRLRRNLRKWEQKSKLNKWIV